MSNLLVKAMTYQFPEEIPIGVGVLPAAWIKNYEGFARLAKEYPDLMPKAPDKNKIIENLPLSYRLGTYIDDWGCVWENIDEGMEAIVKKHPVPKREDIINVKIPETVNGYLPHGFMYLRLLDLRGFEEAMFDFADECDELQILIDKVVEHNIRQIHEALKSKPTVMYFGDDLGMQNGLAIGAEKWRKYLKPAFAKMYKIVRDANTYVYMHTDGMIYEIMPDLAECGVNMINPQYRANGIDNLERVCKGKIPINLDLDRQLFPFGTPREIEEHVRECVERLYLPEGGLGLNIELNYEIPEKNVAALMEALRKYKHYKG